MLIRVTDPRRIRRYCPAQWRVMLRVSTAARIKDMQLRKLRLTAAAVDWKGVGLPQPGDDDPRAPAYRALRRASETLALDDIRAAYRAMAAEVGAEVEEAPPC